MSATSRRGLALLVASGLLAATVSGCSGDDPKASGTPSQTPTSSPTSAAPTESPSPTETPTPERPSAPAFAPGEKGQKAFAEYVVGSWSYALATNDAAVVTDLSPSKKEQCRGCRELAAELDKRAEEGWAVAFPGADVRRTTLAREGERILATTIADIPASTSYFDDGTVRNENRAHQGARFLIDLRIDGQAKKREYVLLAFSVR